MYWKVLMGVGEEEVRSIDLVSAVHSFIFVKIRLMLPSEIC